MISEHERLQMCLKDMAKTKTEAERRDEAVRAIPFGFPEKKPAQEKAK